MAGKPLNVRQQGLQQAASVLFALMAVLPLLVFAYTLWHLGALEQTFAQASLAVTLVLALLGFWMFRSMLAQMSEVVRGVSRMVQAATRPSVPSGRVPAPAPMPPPQVPREVAGLGSIWEFGEMARTMDLLWEREARAHIGRRVQVTVANAEEISGVLVEATDDGVLLEGSDGETVAITYRRVHGIEPLIE